MLALGECKVFGKSCFAVEDVDFLWWLVWVVTVSCGLRENEEDSEDCGIEPEDDRLKTCWLLSGLDFTIQRKQTESEEGVKCLDSSYV